MSNMRVPYEELKLSFGKYCKTSGTNLCGMRKLVLKSSCSVSQPRMMKEKAICPMND
jgi:hypothetical protein